LKYLAIHIHEPARQRARDLANTPGFANAQRQRKKVEALFAELKNQIGLRRLRLRRMKFVREQFFLAAARPRPEHQTTGPLPQPIATIHLARDDLVVALRRRTPVDRNAHDRDRVSFRRSFFNTHACFEQLTETDAVMG